MIRLLCVSLLAVAFVAAQYRDLVPIPAAAGKNQNGYTYLKLSTMLNLYGTPCPLTQTCSAVTNAKLKPKIETRRIGRFTFSGLSMALDALSRALNEVSAKEPGLYAAMGSSGMLCCRAIRGSTTSYSNHAWGAAVDINMQGVLDPRGDGKCQRGLLTLWPYMAKQGFYWAAGYSGASEDSMHFEIADEVMRNWGTSGDWGNCKSSTGVAGQCIPTGQCNAKTESGLCPGPTDIKCCYSGTAAPPPLAKYVCSTADTLNIRDGPCTTFGVVGQARKGDSMQVINGNAVAGCSNNWIQIRRNGLTGYVANSFTVDCVPVAAYDANNTLSEELLNGTLFFGDGDVDFALDPNAEEEGSASTLVMLMSALLALMIVF